MSLRILVLTNLFPTRWDPHRGAFNRQQFERLGQRHEVEVITAVPLPERLRGRSAGQAPAVAGLHLRTFVFVYLPRVGRSLHAFFWAVSLLAQQGWHLLRGHYDCVLASWAYPDAAAAGWLARRMGWPYVVKVHGSDLNVQAEDPARRPQIRKALVGARAVVAVSRALADKAVALGVEPARVHVVYNGVDHARFSPGSRPEARHRLDLPGDVPVLLYVGNLKASKGCMDLLEAFAPVAQARPGARLVFVGAGECRDALRARADELGLGGAVRLVGATPHADLPDWFRAATLLCLPSHNEGVPNVVLEAMACGIPVVATRVGGIPEVVPGEGGLLVPVRDRHALAEALVQATALPWDTGRILEHARQFSWERNLQSLSDILEAAAADSPLPTSLPT
ncbi:glycosyltransferase family 4 protein [Dyella lutea]|uniref:Glycosyltransferase family 4 protein n=1 Tax=Dyella lutea TaxID=2950441 RepID=A0ABT1FAB5_9GAMM|nr:glycosyltransferase family 4 protein [Dyella lutea]MCP1373348.1 glycosyltransferase family 4 protein [Dyella lutea]